MKPDGTFGAKAWRAGLLAERKTRENYRDERSVARMAKDEAMRAIDATLAQHVREVLGRLDHEYEPNVPKLWRDGYSAGFDACREEAARALLGISPDAPSPLDQTDE